MEKIRNKSMTLVTILMILATIQAVSASIPSQPAKITDLGTLTVTGDDISEAIAVNDNDQIVGTSANNSISHAVLWEKVGNGPGQGFSYQITTVLPTLGGDGAHASDIDNFGRIVGVSYDNNENAFATLWQKAGNGFYEPTNLGALQGSSFSEALGTNFFAGGDIVGESNTLELTTHAVLWNQLSNYNPVDLGTLPGDQDSGANAVNSLGQIVGVSVFHPLPIFTPITKNKIMDIKNNFENPLKSKNPLKSSSFKSPDFNFTAVTWEVIDYFNGKPIVSSTPTELPSLGGFLSQTGCCDSDAADINDAGQIVGISLDTAGKLHAVKWQKVGTNYVIIDLGVPSTDTEGGVHGINNHGKIVGVSFNDADISSAIIWKVSNNGVYTPVVFGNLPGGSESEALDINDKNGQGQVLQTVGRGTTASGKLHAVLWEIKLPCPNCVFNPP